MRADAVAALGEARPDIAVEHVPGVNHYTVLLEPAGVDAVVAATHRLRAGA